MSPAPADVFPSGAMDILSGPSGCAGGLIDLIPPSDCLVAGQTAPSPHPQGNRSPRDRERGYWSNLDSHRNRLPFLSYCPPQSMIGSQVGVRVYKGARILFDCLRRMTRGLRASGAAQVIVLHYSLEFADCIESGKEQSALLTGSSIEGVFDSVHDGILRILESLLARYRIPFHQSAFKQLLPITYRTRGRFRTDVFAHGIPLMLILTCHL